MIGFQFTEYRPEKELRTPFERLLDIFLELVTHTSGDVDEALDWMHELDKEHKLTDEDYTLDDFIAELKEKNFLKDGDGKGGGFRITAKN